jgi:rod shape-determining protein MreD
MRKSPVLQNVGGALVAVLVAFLGYSLLGATARELIYLVNFFSIIVIVASMKKGGLFGAVIGTVCGLLQDSFSFGVFGVAGLTKTILGFMTGGISRRIDVSSLGRNFLFTLILSTFELVLWMLLAALVRRQPVFIDHGLMLLQPLVTALLGNLFLRFERKAKRSGR